MNISKEIYNKDQQRQTFNEVEKLWISGQGGSTEKVTGAHY